MYIVHEIEEFYETNIWLRCVIIIKKAWAECVFYLIYNYYLYWYW